MEPHVYDSGIGKITLQIPEETAHHSTKLMQLRYPYLIILKLKIYSTFFFLVMFFVCTFCYLEHLCFFSSFLSQ